MDESAKPLTPQDDWLSCKQATQVRYKLRRLHVYTSVQLQLHSAHCYMKSDHFILIGEWLVIGDDVAVI